MRAKNRVEAFRESPKSFGMPLRMKIPPLPRRDELCDSLERGERLASGLGEGQNQPFESITFQTFALQIRRFCIGTELNILWKGH